MRGICLINPRSASGLQLIKTLLHQYEWKGFFEGINFMADLLRGTSTCKELRLKVPGYCRIPVHDVESTVAFWAKVFQPVIRLNRQVETTFLICCYPRQGDFDLERALQCQEATCLQVRDDLQAHKDVLDGESRYQPSRRWRSHQVETLIRMALSKMKSLSI